MNSTAGERLAEKFSVPFAQHGSGWEDLWKENFLPWDKGEAHPALVDLLRDRLELIGAPVNADGSRRRAFVPGFGRGYDVLLLSACGFEVYGLDVAPSAIRACEKLAVEQADRHRDLVPTPGPGPYHLVVGDYFSSEWQHAEGVSDGFDVIYDYTFLCALPPSQRPAWSERCRELLRRSSDSRLICLEFPVFKDPKTGGPPWNLRPDVLQAHLTRPGEEIPYVDGYPDPGAYRPLDANQVPQIPSRSLARIAHWQPERSFPAGKGTDWVSVWKLADPEAA